METVCRNGTDDSDRIVWERQKGTIYKMEDKQYKQEYEKEKKKRVNLSLELADAKAEIESLQFQLDRIKNSFFWKLSKPFRVIVHFFLRWKNRLAGYRHPKAMMRKIKNKLLEKQAMKKHGRASFPTPEERSRQRNEKFSKQIKFSILVPLYNTPENFLREMIDSVVAQTYQNWELCLADGSDKEHNFVGEICGQYCKKDARIVYKKLEKNEGISGNTNACFQMATGNYIGLFDHDDILHPSVLYEYMKVICEKDADYVYCDEATFKNGDIDNMITLHFKSDYAIDTLRANNYICHFSVFDRQLLENTELFRTKFDGSQDHDMILRLTTKAKKVVHVPKLLYYWRSHKGSVASDISAKTYAIEAARGAVSDHLRTQGFENFQVVSTRAFETIFRIKYEVLGFPKVSIIIANKDHVEDLQRCIHSILNSSTYDNYEIIVVENNSTEEKTFAYYEELKKQNNIKIVTYEGEFNYSKINNLGVSNAQGEYVLLLNNDTQVISINWIEELLMYAQREDVGAVGAKLYYADRTIQHAGIVIGLGAHRTAGHTHYGVAMENVGYMGKLCYAQDVTAVTGACLMVKKSLYEQVGGLEEAFAVALNDVDFCLKLRKAGYLNVCNPYCELYHFESKSRGLDDKDDRAIRYNKECEQFREKWKDELEKGDPYYNPNFSLDKSDYSLKV